MTTYCQVYPILVSVVRLNTDFLGGFLNIACIHLFCSAASFHPRRIWLSSFWGCTEATTAGFYRYAYRYGCLYTAVDMGDAQCDAA